MKFIATSDWHIGNLFHGNDRLPEHRHFLEWLQTQLSQHRPDALLIAGDIFDNGNPSAAAQSAYYEFLADATRLCPEMTVIITSGNHDSASRLEAPRVLLARHNIEVRGMVNRTWHHSEEGGEWVTDYDDLLIPVKGADGSKAVVLAVPFLRHDVAGGGCYSAGVNNFLRSLTSRARERFPDTPLVLMAHLYAKGADIAPKDASERIVIGGQEEVNMEGWADHPDYFVCGHIHKRQHIPGVSWGRYCGSVLPMSFAEIDYRHGVDLVTVERGASPQVTFLEYQPQHKLRILPENEEALSPASIMKLVKRELPDRADDGILDDSFEYILLKVKQDKVSNDDIKKIEALLATKNAVLCKIQKILPELATATLSGEEKISGVDDILDRDPLETIKEAFLIRHNAEMTTRQENMLKEVLTSINDAE